MQTQINNWLEKAKKEAEEKINEENKFVKLAEGDNIVELSLESEPEKVLNRFGNKVYIWKTPNGKEFHASLFLHYKILQVITQEDLQNKKVTLLIKKIGMGQNTKYEVSKK